MKRLLCLSLLLIGNNLLSMDAEAKMEDITDLLSRRESAKSKTSRLLPTILVHGVTSKKEAMLPMANFVTNVDPKVEIKFLDIPYTSITDLDDQVEWVEKELLKDPTLQHGCNVIAHSQGTLLMRGVTQRGNLPVRSFIGLAGPQGGVSHITEGVKEQLPGFVMDMIESMGLENDEEYCAIMCNEYMRDGFSIPDFWYEPNHHDEFLESAPFLARLNNMVDHEDFETYRENLKKLNYAVFVMPEAEEIVAPKESCLFGMYEPYQRTKITPVQLSHIYENLGLSDLAQEGKLILTILEGTDADHASVRTNPDNFTHNILPYLTYATEKELELITAAEKIDTTTDTVGETCCSCLAVFCKCKKVRCNVL